MVAQLRKIVRKIINPYRTLEVTAGKAKVLINKEAPQKFTKYWENYAYDLERFLKYSSTIKVLDDQLNLKSRIIAKYHVIEKGLSLQAPRLGFGRPALEALISDLSQYIDKGYPLDDGQFIAAIKVLFAYCEYHSCRNVDVNDILEKIGKFSSYIETQENISGGSKQVKKADILNSINNGFENLAFSRHSLRNFSDEEISLENLHQAIKIAQRTPSVCNRQASQVYIIQEKPMIEKALEYQNGNRGFGHLANKLLIVTASLRAMNDISERNQAFIDGGMFGMSLIYALHSLGIGTCTLNWSAPKERDLELRKAMPIKEDEVVIFMIAVGGFPEEFNVANSHRKPLEEIVTEI